MPTKEDILDRADDIEADLVREMAETLKGSSAIPAAFAYRWQQVERSKQLADLDKLDRADDIQNDISNASSV